VFGAAEANSMNSLFDYANKKKIEATTVVMKN